VPFLAQDTFYCRVAQKILDLGVDKLLTFNYIYAKVLAKSGIF